MMMIYICVHRKLLPVKGRADKVPVSPRVSQTGGASQMEGGKYRCCVHPGDNDDSARCAALPPVIQHAEVLLRLLHLHHTLENKVVTLKLRLRV
jgi:hypothetical protein